MYAGCDPSKISSVESLDRSVVTDRFDPETRARRRAAEGAPAAAFLKTVCELLEEPELFNC